MEHTVDAKNQSLGRLASEIAVLLRGKNSASYTPNKLVGVIVVLKNLKGAKFTGSKFDQKKYYHHSGYHSGIKARKLSELWESKPQEVLRKMVWRMLPINRSRDKIIRNLRFDG